MTTQHPAEFDEQHVLHELKHYLPAQSPLKDFIHHNTLHAFQKLKFDVALVNASVIFGYKVLLKLSEYRNFITENKISQKILDKIIIEQKGETNLAAWRDKVMNASYTTSMPHRIGALRNSWKTQYMIDLDTLTHPILYRILCSYLDQGISIWNFPVQHQGFLASLRELEKTSFTSFFNCERARKLLLEGTCSIESLLDILIEDKSLYEQYLFDQQFAHQGWSGIVSAVEDQPQTLIDQKSISLRDLIIFELLLEIDALDKKFGPNWTPLKNKIVIKPVGLFDKIKSTEIQEVILLLHKAFEWTYYDDVLSSVQLCQSKNEKRSSPSFQAMFCLDDREISLRRYLETEDKHCETFATAGFFNVEFFYQPENGRFYTKLCPAPVHPNYLIKEIENPNRRKKDAHFSKHSHSIFRGFVISQTLGFVSAFKLFFQIFRPTMSPATAHSFKHMDKNSKLIIECDNPEKRENDLQIGFTVDEMVSRVEGLLRSIGLTTNFAPIIYVVGHGSSSVNNPHYAAYDCGACSGRPGSVNARVVSFMANHPKVRTELKKRGIVIPDNTLFVGGLHDTCRDEVEFFDENLITPDQIESHLRNCETFKKALDLNSKERSRRFELIDSTLSPEKIHSKVKLRSVSLFEPRPELNHATNALCFVGRRELTKGIYFDRRSFMNSYDYSIDPNGEYLFGILKAVAPVCGGINLEYFFSRVDNQKLGAGSKLPHNVMGLFGVANGIDGDLRPGLPIQMVEVHDPVRLLVIVEHFHPIVLKTIQKNDDTYEWFINEWVHLATVDPETKEIYYFNKGEFEKYNPINKDIKITSDLNKIIETETDNIPVLILK